MKKNPTIFIFCLLLIGIFAGMVSAAVPNFINVQGILSNGQGQPYKNWNGRVYFNLYNNDTGGQLMWKTKDEGIDVQTDANGFFSYAIDLKNDGNFEPNFDYSKTFAKRTHMEIIVEGVTLAPRQHMVSVPYAIMSAYQHGGTVRAISSDDNAVHGIGLRGVVGIDRSDPANVYGVLGGPPQPFVSLIGIEYKHGAYGQISKFTSGVLGYQRNNTNINNIEEAGVFGYSKDNSGVYGQSYGGYGVKAYSETGQAVRAEGPIAVDAIGSGATGYGVAAKADGTTAKALYGSSANGWGLFVSADKSHISGKLGIGTAFPNKDLEVNGAVRISQDGTPGNKADLGYYIDKDGGTDDGFFINSDTGGSWSDIHLQTRGTTKLFIESAGNIGIGTKAPSARMEIFSNSSTSNPQMLLTEDQQDYARLSLKSNVTNRFWTIAGFGGGEFDNTYESAWLNLYFSPKGNLFKIRGDGKIYSSTSLIHSDRRLKDNIVPLTDSLAKIKNLRGVSFVWNQKSVAAGQKGIGLIAQEVETYYPELVSADEDGYKAVDYDKFTAILLEAIKEQQTKIETLEKRIAELEKK